MPRDDREIEKDFQIGSLSLFHPYTNNQKSPVPALSRQFHYVAKKYGEYIEELLQH